MKRLGVGGTENNYMPVLFQHCQCPNMEDPVVNYAGLQVEWSGHRDVLCSWARHFYSVLLVQ